MIVVSSSSLRETCLLALWPSIDALLATENLGAGWTTLAEHLSDKLLALLEAAHFDLERGAHDIPVKARKRFRARIERLLQDIESSELPNELRTALRTILQQGLHALHDYALRGPEGFEADMYTQATLYAKYADVLNAHREQPAVREARGISRRMAQFAGWANNNQGVVMLLIGLGQIAAQLAAGAVPLIMAPPTAPLMLTSGGNNNVAQ